MRGLKGGLRRSLFAALLVSISLQLFRPCATQGEWRRGRTTYYGAPSSITSAFDPSRGEGSFGILAFGSCGYTNSDGTIPFAQDAVGALADANPDYPGSCGRCYKIRCVTGAVVDNSGQILGINGSSFSNGQTYLPAINDEVRDTRGRSWPGNPGAAEDIQAVRCWDDAPEQVIRIIDSCPCTQVLPDGAPGVAQGGEVREQSWCCGGVQHFDISYYAFEKLAHPLYGVMTIEYKPVNCDTKQDLPFSPGYISKTIYKNGFQPGWGWTPLFASSYDYKSEEAPDGTSATCSAVEKGRGGVSFRCRECYKSGYQPLRGARSLDFWIKGPIDDLRVFMLTEETDLYCNNQLTLGNTTFNSQEGEWYSYSIPISDFACSKLDQVDNISFQTDATTDAYFCLASVVIK